MPHSNSRTTTFTEKIEPLKFKVAIVGDSYTGKNCIVNRFITNEFSENYKATIGCDFTPALMAIDGRQVTLQLWNVSGRIYDRQTVTRNFFRKACGVIIVFSTTDNKSINHVEDWMRCANNTVPNVPTILVANKIDLQPLTTETLELLKEDCSFSSCQQTSAKTGVGVTEVFDKLSRLMIEEQKTNKSTASLRNDISLNITKDKEKQNVCSKC